MQHLDPETAGLAALNEPLDRQSLEHLQSCGICSAEIEELKGVVSLARSGEPDTLLETPDSSVWLAIEKELGLPEELRARALGIGTQNTGQALDLTAARESKGRRSERPIPVAWLAAAAGVGVVAGAGITWGIQAVNPSDSEEVVAQVELAPLPGYEAEGQATLTVADSGNQSLDVTMSGEEPDGYRQVWLIAPDLEQMHSIGLLEGERGSFAVPADIDLTQFPIVDVSDEPLDGNPAHSGVSMVRGTIDVPAPPGAD